MLREGDEPIPGYTLTRFLGKGTFGEVWQARTAGGFRAALKFVDLSVSSGLKEYRGIQRVKDIRHGRLMLMTALWMLDKHGEVIPDQLLAQFDSTGSGAQANVRGTLAVTPILPSMFVVAMPLADKSLLDLLEASEGRGIPLPDLIRYMEHAAEGLDFLNDPVHDLGEDQPVAIQHCDIKPANIMVMGNAAVICDFGLARILQADGIHHSVSGMAGTYPYMAPECIESPLADRAPQPSFASDQYALAVTYVELRTGRLPFHDEDLSSHLAILRAHCEGRLSLDALPEAERKVIAKATSINPADRYPSNAKMVRHLRRAVRAELDKVQELDPEASGDYSGTKVSAARASSQRARADTDRVRETVPIQKPAATSRRFRRLALGLLPLVAAVVAGALLWKKLTPEGKVAGPKIIAATPAEPKGVPRPAKTPKIESKQPVTPPAPEASTPAEKTDPAAKMAELLAQAEQHAKCLADPTSKDGDWRAAQVGLLAVLKSIAEVEHSSAAQTQRAIHLQLARIEARKQQWAAVFVHLDQVADPKQPTELSQLTPRDQTQYRALQALGHAKADARIVLEYLAAAVDPVGGAELDPWEAHQIAALKDATRPHIEQMLPLADPYDKLCDRVWPEGIAFETLLRRAGDSLAQGKFSAARAALDDARPHAKGDAEQRQLEWHAALLAARDPDVTASDALDAFRRTVPAATTQWQARLTTAMIERIEQLGTEELSQWSRMVQEANENYFEVDEGAAPDDPQSMQSRDARVQLHLRLGEALAQQADPQYHGAAAANQTAPTDQLLKQAETSATAAIELLPKSIGAGPERKSKSRAVGILGRVYYEQFKAADPSQRKQRGATAIANLEQATLLAASVDDSALWRIMLADVQLQLARALEPELKRIQDKIAKLTIPADKKAVSERDEMPLVAERDRLLKQAQAALQPIPPTNPHRQRTPALFKALNVP